MYCAVHMADRQIGLERTVLVVYYLLPCLHCPCDYSDFRISRQGDDRYESLDDRTLNGRRHCSRGDQEGISRKKDFWRNRHRFHVFSLFFSLFIVIFIFSSLGMVWQCQELGRVAHIHKNALEPFRETEAFFDARHVRMETWGFRDTGVCMESQYSRPVHEGSVSKMDRGQTGIATRSTQEWFPEDGPLSISQSVWSTTLKMLLWLYRQEKGKNTTACEVNAKG
ncbi:hypothetical protein ASPWEDRAFT_683475 [Aspergillus wentii DTO 134E9]|uniref:Uncharacterized protein n=1 Tax=Aspergillus wentii DTO 134E9 TaxID=1073089 RepID=A0A1L9R8B7_ASPWE|nr:uncharacterized protein ASPWEDRAFT_683475 [Aspergillus wentii DTO 134E9]OJJ31144.1 hypothetical protein ASPWEDRAFT_683475 [Aspergillus wentii DTO 134E9]